MDYLKVGEFIIKERKAKNLTQEKLAEKLFVSPKTVSKWENGKGIPDTTVLPKLSELFKVTVNELLNGERLSNEKYASAAEERILELQKEKEESHKLLLTTEIIMMSAIFILFLSLIFFASFAPILDWLRVTIIISATVLIFVITFFALKIEQVAGFYECGKCHHKYVPTYKQVNLSMHFGRTRFMKCPCCNKKSWSKKVVK